MNKEILLLLCENMAEVKRQIEETSHNLERLSYQLEDIRRGILDELGENVSDLHYMHGANVVDMDHDSDESDDHAVSKKQESVFEELYEDKDCSDASVHATISSENVVSEQLDAVNEVVFEISNSTNSINHEQSISASKESEDTQLNGTPIEVRYSPIVLSNEFEFSDTEYSKSNRSIYAIEVMSENKARFYPIAEQAKRLISKRSELVDPICIADRDLKEEDFVISESAYGKMERNSYGRWSIVQRCSLQH